MFHFANSLSADAAIAFAKSQPDPEFQIRLDELATRSSAGSLTDAERIEYESYVYTMDFMALLRAKAFVNAGLSEKDS
jgi:hypothetical protein